MSTSNNNKSGGPVTTKGNCGKVTGITLTCTDTSPEGIVHRKYEYSRSGYSTIDLVRATITKAGASLPTDGFDDNGAARATFSSPVMSRRHARITINEDGSVSVTDLRSLHGTYVHGNRLEHDVPFIIESGDTIVLGKAILRDSKFWEPASLQVTITRAPLLDDEKELSPMSNTFVASSQISGDSEDDDDEVRSTPNRYGVHMYSPSYNSSDMTDSEELETSSDSQSSEGSDSQQDAFGSPDLDVESPSSESRSSPSTTPSVTYKLCSILPFDIGRLVPVPGTPSRLPLPSLRDLGFFSSAAARANADGNRNEASACSTSTEQPPSLCEVADEPSTRRREPHMASLQPPPQPPNHIMMNYPIGPSNTGTITNNFYHVHASHNMLPPDGSSNMFFPGDNFSQFIPSFPQNQLGALDFVNDMQEFGMNDLPLPPGGLGESGPLVGPSLGHNSVNADVVENSHNALHERSRASSPMEISSGRPSPDPDQDKASPEIPDAIRDGTESSNEGPEEVVDSDDLPRSTLFLPPQRVKNLRPVTRTPSPEVTEISREKYMADAESKKERNNGLSSVDIADSGDEADNQEEDLHRYIMSDGMPSSSSQQNLRRLFLAAVHMAKIKGANLDANDTSSPVRLRSIPFARGAVPVEVDNSNGVEQPSQSGPTNTDEQHNGAPQKSPSIRSESCFSSLPSRIQSLVASELTNVTSRIADLKESIGGLRPIFERQVAASLAMAAARSSNGTSRESVETITPTSPTVTSEADAKRDSDLQDIREEMLRFSAIMEQVLEKIEPLRVQAEQAVQADITEPKEMAPQTRKRKFSELDIEESLAMNMCCDSEDYETDERPTKRARTPSGSIARSVATAAGYTSLGAVLTFVTFAYLL